MDRLPSIIWQYMIKRLAVLFTCMSTRAIHIEVIESMDSSSFINTLRWFFSVRGPVKQIRSDCGLNFIVACRELKMEAVQSDKGCTWVFNPPHSFHMGGSWERMTGVTRRILDFMLLKVGPSKLPHEVLTPFMVEVSAIINAWFLCLRIQTPPNLTPATLLTQKVAAIPHPQGELNEKDLFSRQWRQVQSRHLLAPLEEIIYSFPAELSEVAKWEAQPERQPSKKKRLAHGHRQKDLSRQRWKGEKGRSQDSKRGVMTSLRPVSETILPLSPETDK